MADKRIQDLTPATSVGSDDQFVLEQSGQAKSLTGQILIQDLAAALDGHGGISNVSYTPPEYPSLDGTLTITTADGTAYNVSLTNGRGITGITWSSSGTQGDGLLHTGTISYSDGTTSQVQIQDGYKGDRGFQTYVWFKWANVYPTQDSDMSNSAGPYIGVYSGLSSTAPTHYTDYVWYEYKGEKGDTGASIQSIALTSSAGLVDTYTITLTDGNTAQFTVTNAKSIVSVTMTSGSHAAGTTDIYTITFNDGDTAQFSVYNGANGLGSVSTVSGIQADGAGNVPQVISGNGAPTTATVGQVNQLYYDLTNSIIYYCLGESGGTYVWQGAGVTVDSALSGSSENPVQNKVITGRVGTGSLPNSNTNLTDAVHYVNGRIPTAASQTPLTDTTNGAVGTGTNFARNDHRHPLNVPTSGTPADLGTASQGTAATYSRSDHVHAMPSAADVGALTSDDVNYKIYNSVTDIGLTSGSATIAGAWTAMPDASILICTASDFSQSETPTSGNYLGTIEITKLDVNRSFIQAFGKTDSAADYRMFCDAATGAPTGTWVPVYTGAVQSSTCTAASGITFNGNYVKKVGNLVCLYFRAAKTGSNAAVATIPAGFRPATDFFMRVGSYPNGSATPDVIPVNINADGAVTTRASFAGEVTVNATYFTN